MVLGGGGGWSRTGGGGEGGHCWYLMDIELSLDTVFLAKAMAPISIWSFKKPPKINTKKTVIKCYQTNMIYCTPEEIVPGPTVVQKTKQIENKLVPV